VTHVAVKASDVSALLPLGFAPQNGTSREGFAWTIAHDLTAAYGKSMCVDCGSAGRSKWACNCGCSELLTVPDGSEDLAEIVNLIVALDYRPVRLGNVFFEADVNDLDWPE